MVLRRRLCFHPPTAGSNMLMLLPPAIRGQSGSVSVLPNPPTAGDKVSLPAAAVLTNSTPMSAPLAVSMPAAAVSAAGE